MSGDRFFQSMPFVPSAPGEVNPYDDMPEGAPNPTSFVQGRPFVKDAQIQNPWDLEWDVGTVPTLRGTIDESGTATAKPEQSVPAARVPFGQQITDAIQSIITPVVAAAPEAQKDITQTSSLLWGKNYSRTPSAAPELEAPITTKDSPGTIGQKALFQATRFAPTAVAGSLGALVAPEAGVAALVGGAVGTMLGTFGQVLGQNFAAAHEAHPGDPDAAYTEAVRTTAIDTGATGLGALALGATPFAGALKNALFQTFVVQPAVGVAGSKAHQFVAGQDSGLSLGDEYLNMLAPSVLMAGVGATMPHGAAETAGREPWALPWQKAGEEYHIAPELAAAIPEEGGGEHPAEQYGVAQRVKNPVEAWHGSPHDFDEFHVTPRTVGTGEGGQMFGEGGYFGEQRGVGEQYRNELGVKEFQDPAKLQKFAYDNNISETAAKFLVQRYQYGERGPQFAETLRGLDAPVNARFKAQLGDDIPKLQQAFAELSKSGKLYNVNLHIEPHQTVDWDAPIKNQPEAIQKLAQKYVPADQNPPMAARHVLSRAMREVGGRPEHDNIAMTIDNDKDMYDAAWAFAKDEMPKSQYNTMRDRGESVGDWITRRFGGFIERKGFGARTGGELINLMHDHHGQTDTARMLRDAGIRGIKYLDQGSRVHGEGSRNWVMLHGEDVEIKAKMQRARDDVDRNPTEAQKAAGNYRKGHLNWNGLNVAIENPKGANRHGIGPDGKAWSVEMPADYGYVKRTKGADHEPLDVYIGPQHDSQKVFAVDQMDAGTGKFDEHKFMLGFPDEAAARETYMRGFSDGRGAERIGAMTEMPLDEFKRLVDKGGRKAPIAQRAALQRPAFFYKSERLLDELPVKRATGTQWDATLRNKGVKAEELDDLGIADFLKRSGDTPVSKDQIKALIDANRADFKEINYEAKQAVDLQHLQRQPRFAPYQLPGGQNYREMVLTLPPKQGDSPAEIRQSARDLADRSGDNWETLGPNGRQRYFDMARKTSPEIYTSSHWPGIDNPLAHARLSDRTGADGAKILHIEEGQSDVHNEGKAEGYKAPQAETEAARANLKAAQTRFSKAGHEHQRLYDQITELKKAMNTDAPRLWRIYDRDDHSKVIWEGKPGDGPNDALAAAKHLDAGPNQIDNPRIYHPEQQAKLLELQNEYSRQQREEYQPASREMVAAERQVHDVDKGKIWNAPFKKSFGELLLKKMVHYAAENGYDRIVWTPGDEQAKRFSLDTHLSRLDYRSEDGKVWELTGYDKNHNTVDSIDRVVVSDSELERTVGKEMAEKIRRHEGRHNAGAGSKIARELTGSDLKVTDQGKRQTYDVIWPSFLKKLGAKFGAKAGKENIDIGGARNFEGMPDQDRMRFLLQTDRYLQLPMNVRAEIADYYHRVRTGTDPQEAGRQRGLSEDALKFLGAKDVGAQEKPFAVHSFELTPELKRSVLEEGQPLYQRGQQPAEGGAYERVIPTKRSLSPEQRRAHGNMLRQIEAAVKTMAPHVKVLPVSELYETRQSGVKSQGTGAFFPESKVGPLIVLALEGPDGFNEKIAGSARHEVMHALKDSGAISQQQWKTLSDAAEKQNWLAKHNIEARYPELGRSGQIEEAIAEEFGKSYGDSFVAHAPLVRKVFAKLRNMLQAVAGAARRVFGRDATAGDIMRQIETGEIGWKRPGGAGDSEVKFQRSAPTDTPEFKRWFGKSAVRDGSGKPKVVYHATDSDFEKFASTNDIGYHFGTEEHANDRLTQLQWDEHDHKGHILPVYLKIERPLRLPDLGNWDAHEILDELLERGIISEKEHVRLERESVRTDLDFGKLLNSKGYDGVVYRNEGEGKRPMTLSDFDQVSVRPVKYRLPGDESFFEAVTAGGDSVGVAKTEGDALNQARHAAREGRPITTGDSYIVFDPRQVKSAFNRGTFDPANRSFMMQRGKAPEDGQAAGTRPEETGFPERSSVRGGAGVLSTPPAEGDAAPLIGLPTNIKVPGHPGIQAGPFPTARRLARDYANSAGIAYEPLQTYAKVDVPRAKRIAAAYDEMRHDPHDPEVRRAYAAMAKETLAQWQTIKGSGLKVEFIDPEKGDPYYASPRLAIEDVKNNNHLWVFATDDGYGTEGVTARDMDENPMLEFAHGEKIGDRPARVNDIFRVVHDYFGHIKDGVGFRADGEENAWRSHSRMYSPEAARAMTSETRGQNSWLNYGPHGEKNRTAKSEDTVYAEQKIGLMPEWTQREGLEDDPSMLRAGQAPDARQRDMFEPDPAQVRQKNFHNWFASSKVTDDAGRPRVMYHWTPAKTDFDAFRRKLGDIGIHFGTLGQAEDRGDFLKLHAQQRGAPLEGDRIMPVYLKIQKPMRVEDVGSFSFDNLATAIRQKVNRGELPHYPWKEKLSEIERKQRTPNGQLAALRDFMERQGYDGLVYKNTGETEGGAGLYENMQRLQRAAVEGQKRRGKSPNAYDEEDRQQPEYLAWKKAEQADREHRDQNGQDSYVAFRPEQVKSAIGNRGTFDPKKKSILMQRGDGKKPVIVERRRLGVPAPTHRDRKSPAFDAYMRGSLPL